MTERNWRALVDVDGAPANGRFRENEMILVECGKRAYIWRNTGDPRTWVRTYVGATMTERNFTDWDVATNFACETLGVVYTKTPTYSVALADARAQLAIEKAKTKKPRAPAPTSTDGLESLRGEAPLGANEVN